MNVRFEWNVTDQLVEKTFKLMGEFEQGEHHVVIAECFKAQRKLECRFSICQFTQRSIVYESKEFLQNSADSLCSLLCGD